MIKLIVSDIDGTLLPYGSAALDEKLFELILRLRERGVIFCPASGRQYHSLRALFAPVCDELTYLCENGAIVYGPGPEDKAAVLGKTVMDRETARARHTGPARGQTADLRREHQLHPARRPGL